MWRGTESRLCIGLCLLGASGLGERWVCEHAYWMNSLTELAAIHKNMVSTAGLYNHFRRELSSWTWDYAEQVWQEEDHGGAPEFRKVVVAPELEQTPQPSDTGHTRQTTMR